MSEAAAKTISVGIVDDHPFVHKGVGTFIDLDRKLSLSWSALSEEAALECVKRDPVDALIVDLKIGASSGGIRILEHLKRMNGADTVVVVFSAFSSQRMVREAYRAGASGFFSKTQDVSELISGIKRLVRETDVPFLGPYSDWAKPYPYLELSKREIEVLSEIAKGYSNPEVAAALGLKIGTIKTHLESIYRKLGVNSRTEALRFALEEGYFDLDELR